MSIGIFLGTVGTQAGGCETYEKILLSTLAATDRDTPYDVYFLNKLAQASIGPLPANFVSHVLWPDSRWVSMSLSLPAALRNSRVGLLHATYFPPYFCPVPFIGMMHSVVTYVMPEFYPPPIRLRLNALIDRIVKKARFIICVSKHDRDFIADRFGLDDDRLGVVYHGVGDQFRPRPATETASLLKNKYGISSPYFFFAGKLMHAKNIFRILEAFQLFRSRQPGTPMEFVLAGRRLWINGSEKIRLDRLVALGGVRELGHVSHEDLPLLYAGAHSLVFPSYWEGFGIPIIEAMASGTPVLTSNLSSCPEVAGGAALLVDPFDLEAITHQMERLAEDATLCRTLAAQGLEQARQFTWANAMEQTRQVYRRFDPSFRG